MQRFKNILYVNETAVDQTAALARAVSLAQNNQARLTIIDVIPTVAAAHRDDATAERMQALETLIASYRQEIKIRFETRMGTAFLEIIRVVLGNGHDLVIKAAENRDFLKRLFGSDDMHLLRKCPCPVWLMKPLEMPKYGCILAAVDFDPLRPLDGEQALNRQILELAGSLALSDAAALHLVHAWDAFGENVVRARGDNTAKGVAAYVENERMRHQNGLFQLGERLRDRMGAEAYNDLAPRFHLPKGPAQKMIAAAAAELQADLVVMGTVARTGIAGLIIGNTAEAILDQLACSVLAVKPAGFSTPVKPAV